AGPGALRQQQVEGGAPAGPDPSPAPLPHRKARPDHRELSPVILRALWLIARRSFWSKGGAAPPPLEPPLLFASIGFSQPPAEGSGSILLRGFLIPSDGHAGVCPAFCCELPPGTTHGIQGRRRE